MKPVIYTAKVVLALAALSMQGSWAQGALPADAFDLGTPVQASSLDASRGGFDLLKNDMQLSGTVANNAATNVRAGSNSISEGAFANSSGFPMVVQNSGSNVLIQNATIVNVQFQ